VKEGGTYYFNKCLSLCTLWLTANSGLNSKLIGFDKKEMSLREKRRNLIEVVLFLSSKEASNNFLLSKISNN
jgi:hypothetical protein